MHWLCAKSEHDAARGRDAARHRARLSGAGDGYANARNLGLARRAFGRGAVDRLGGVPDGRFFVHRFRDCVDLVYRPAVASRPLG